MEQEDAQRRPHRAQEQRRLIGNDERPRHRPERREQKHRRAEPATRPTYRPNVAGLSHSPGPGVGTVVLTQYTATAVSPPTTASTSNRRRQSVSPGRAGAVRANEEPSRCRLMVERMIQ